MNQKSILRTSFDATTDLKEFIIPLTMNPDLLFWSINDSAVTYAALQHLTEVPPRKKLTNASNQAFLEPSDDDKVISSKFEKWREHVASVGDLVDAWTLGISEEQKNEPRGWHQVKIIKFDDYRTTAKILKSEGPPFKELWISSDHLAPLSTFSGKSTDWTKISSSESSLAESSAIMCDTDQLFPGEIDWRNSLRLGSMLDAMDSEGSWLRAVIVECNSETIIEDMQSSIKDPQQSLFRVSFIGFGCEHDEIIGRFSPYICRLNLRSGGKRGPIESPWNVESDEERDMSPYLIPEFSQAHEDGSNFHFRLCTPFSNQKGLQFCDFLKDMDEYLTKYSDGDFTLFDKLFYKMNNAFVPNGHVLPVQFFSDWTPMLGKIADLFSSIGIDELLKPLVDCIFRWTNRTILEWKDDIRLLSKENVEMILLGLYRISRRWLSKEECGKLVEENIALGLILRLFRSKVNMKRSDGLKLLNDLTSMCRNAEEFPFGIKKVSNNEFIRVPISLHMTSFTLAKWISENNLVNDIFAADQYRELVRLSGDLVLLLSKHNLVTETTITDIWTTFDSTDELDVECAVEMLSGIATKLDTTTCLALLNKTISAGGTHFPNQTARIFNIFATSQTLVVDEHDDQLIENSAHDQSGLIVKRAMTGLYVLSLGIPLSVLNPNRSSTATIIDDATLSASSLRSLTDALGFQSCRKYRSVILTLCVRNIAHHVFVTRSINIIKSILTLYPAPVTTPRSNPHVVSPTYLQQHQPLLATPRQGRAKRSLPLSPSESKESIQRVLTSHNAEASAELISEYKSGETSRMDFGDDNVLETVNSMLANPEEARKAGVDITNEDVKRSLVTMSLQPALMAALVPNATSVLDGIHAAVKCLVEVKATLSSKSRIPFLSTSSDKKFREPTAADMIKELNEKCNLTAVLIRHLLTFCNAGHRLSTDLGIQPAFEYYSSKVNKMSTDFVNDADQASLLEATAIFDDQDIDVLDSDDSDHTPIAQVDDSIIKALFVDPVNLSLNLPSALTRGAPFLIGFHNILDFLGTTVSLNDDFFLDSSQTTQLWDECVSHSLTEKQRTTSILWFVRGTEGLARATFCDSTTRKENSDVSSSNPSSIAAVSSSEVGALAPLLDINPIITSGFGVLFQPETAVRIFREQLLKTDIAVLDSALLVAWRTFFLYTAGYKGHIGFHGGVFSLSEIANPPKDRVGLNTLDPATTTFAFPLPQYSSRHPSSDLSFLNHDPEGMSELWNIALNATGSQVAKAGGYLLTYLLQRVVDIGGSVRSAHLHLRRTYVLRCMQEIRTAMELRHASQLTYGSMELTIERCVGLLDIIVDDSEEETAHIFSLLRCALAIVMSFDPNVLKDSGIASKLDAVCAKARNILTFASHAPDAYSFFEGEGTTTSALGSGLRFDRSLPQIDPDSSAVARLKFVGSSGLSTGILPDIGLVSMDTSSTEQTNLSSPLSSPKANDHYLFMGSHEKARDLLIFVSSLTGVPTRRLGIRYISSSVKNVVMRGSALGKTFAEIQELQQVSMFLVKCDTSDDNRSIIDHLLSFDSSFGVNGIKSATLAPSNLLTILENILNQAQSLPAVILSDDRNNMGLFFSFLDKQSSVTGTASASSSTVSPVTSLAVWRFLCRIPTSPVLLEMLIPRNSNTSINWESVLPDNSPSFRLYASLLLRRLTSPGAKPGLGLCTFATSFDTLSKTIVSRSKDSPSTSVSVHIHGALLIDKALQRLVRRDEDRSEEMISKPISFIRGDAAMNDYFRMLHIDFATNGLKRVFALFVQSAETFPDTIVLQTPTSAQSYVSTASAITLFRIVQRYVMSSAISCSSSVSRARFLSYKPTSIDLEMISTDSLIHEAKPCLNLGDNNLAKTILESISLDTLQTTLVLIVTQHLNAESRLMNDETIEHIKPLTLLICRLGLQTIVSSIYLWASLCIYDVKLWNAQSSNLSQFLHRLLLGPKSNNLTNNGVLDISEGNVVIKLQCAIVSSLMSISSLCRNSDNSTETSSPSNFILELLIASRPKGVDDCRSASISLYYSLLETLLRDELVLLQKQQHGLNAHSLSSAASTSTPLLSTIKLPTRFMEMLKDLLSVIKSPSLLAETPLIAAAANAELRNLESITMATKAAAVAATATTATTATTTGPKKLSETASTDTDMSTDLQGRPESSIKFVSPLSETVSFTRSMLCTGLNSHLQSLRPLYSLVPMHPQYLSLGRDPASTSCWESRNVLKRAVIDALQKHPDSGNLKCPVDLFDSPGASAAITSAFNGFGTDSATNIDIDPTVTEEAVISTIVGIDQSLIGCFRLATALVEADPESSVLLANLNIVNSVEEVFNSLFPQEIKDSAFTGTGHLVKVHSSCGMTWPKCVSNATRKEAFHLLLALIRRNPHNTVVLLKLLENQANKLYEGGQLDFISRPSHAGIFEQSPTGYVGIVNYGATCYMNSLLQQLYMIKPIRYGLLSVADIQLEEVHHNEIAGKNQSKLRKENVLYQIQKVMGFLEYSVRASIEPTLCAAIKDADGKPANEHEQQDAQEFLMLLLDKLESALQSTPRSSLISDVLRFRTSEVKICTGGCNCVRTTPIPGDLNLILDPRLMNMTKALEQLFKWEEIQGFDCQACEKKTTLRKRPAFTHLGDTLICHLKRFSMNWDTQVISKINSRFEFPVDLDLHPYCVDSLVRDPEVIAAGGITSVQAASSREHWQYELVGVVVHTGEYSHGHYYSFIRERGELAKRHNSVSSAPSLSSLLSSSSSSSSRSSREGEGGGAERRGTSRKWFLFDDDRVTDWDIANLERECFGGVNSTDSASGVSTDVEVVSKNAYMLVYERKKPQPISVYIHRDEAILAKDVLGHTFPGFDITAPSTEKQKLTLFASDMIPRDDLGQGFTPLSIAKDIINDNRIFSRTLAQTESFMVKFMLSVVDTVSRQQSILKQAFPLVLDSPSLFDFVDVHEKEMLDVKTVFRSLFLHFAYPIAKGGNTSFAPHYSYALSRLIGSNHDVALLLAKEIIAAEEHINDSILYDADLFCCPLSGFQGSSEYDTWFCSAIFNEKPLIRYSTSRILATCLSVLGMSYEEKVKYEDEISKSYYLKRKFVPNNEKRTTGVFLLDALLGFNDVSKRIMVEKCSKENFRYFDAFFAGIYDAVRLGFGSGLPLQLNVPDVPMRTPANIAAVASALENWGAGETDVLKLNTTAVGLMRLHPNSLTEPSTSQNASTNGVTLSSTVSFRLALSSLKMRRFLAANYGIAAIIDLFLQGDSPVENKGGRFTMKVKSFVPTWTRAFDLAALLLKSTYTPMYGESSNIGSPFHSCLGPIQAACHVPSLGLFGRRSVNTQQNVLTDVEDVKTIVLQRKHLPGLQSGSSLQRSDVLFASSDPVMPPFQAFSLSLPEPSFIDRDILRNYSTQVIDFPETRRQAVETYRSYIQKLKKGEPIPKNFPYQSLSFPTKSIADIEENYKKMETSAKMPPADNDLIHMQPLNLALDGYPYLSGKFNNYTSFCLFDVDTQVSILSKLLGAGLSSFPDARFPDIFGPNIEAMTSLLGHRLSVCSGLGSSQRNEAHNELFNAILHRFFQSTRSTDIIRASFAVIESLLMVQDDFMMNRFDRFVNFIFEVIELRKSQSEFHRMAIECAFEVSRLFILLPDAFVKWINSKKLLVPVNQGLPFDKRRLLLESFLLLLERDMNFVKETPAWQKAAVLDHWGDLNPDEKQLLHPNEINNSMLPGHVVGTTIQTQFHVSEIPYRRYLTVRVAGQPVHALSLREEIFCINESRMSVSLRAVIARQRLARALRGVPNNDSVFSSSTLYKDSFIANIQSAEAPIIPAANKNSR